MLKMILFTMLIILSFSCSKQNELILTSPKQRSFFSSDGYVLRQTQKLIYSFDSSETVSRVDSVTYLDADQKSLAIIAYTSNKGSSNIGIEKTFNSQGKGEGEGTGIKCTGSCGTENCRINALIVNGELQYVECSCSACQMHVNNQ